MNIYVGNLAFSTTDRDLRQLFEPYGMVDEIRVITDRDTGRSKGFGLSRCPMAPPPERRLPSFRARRWRAGPSQSMRPSRVNRAVSPVRLAGKLLGIPGSAQTLADGHPMDGRGGMFPTVSCHMEKSP